MDNQPTDTPQTPVDQPTPPPPQPVVTTPPEQPAPTVGVPVVFVSKPKRWPRVTALVVVLVLAGLAGLYVMNKKPKVQPNTSTVVNNTAATPATAKTKDIPFGTAASDGSFQVKLMAVTPNPTFTGDPPDAGSQYLEADFSITPLANQTSYKFNVNYLPLYVPAGNHVGDIEYAPVDGTTQSTNPLTFGFTDPKAVQIAGKTSAEAADVQFSGSPKTATVYALFEIKPGDKGQISWKGANDVIYVFAQP